MAAAEAQPGDALLVDQQGEVIIPGGTLRVGSIWRTRPGSGRVEVTGDTDLVFNTDKQEHYIRLGAYGGAIRLRANSDTASDRSLQFGVIDNLNNWLPQMTVDTDSGNVGIGTTDPGAMLEVSGMIRADAGEDGQAEPVTALDIQGPNYPANANSAQDVRWSFAAAGSALIRAFRGGSWDTTLSFHTNASNQGGDAPQERMRIDHIGNVGIGTASPQAKLHVAGPARIEGSIDWGWPGRSISQVDMADGTSRRIRFANSMGAGSSNPMGGFEFTDHLGAPLLEVDTVRTILHAGNVGIGTTTPQAKLDVNGDIRCSGELQVGGQFVVDELNAAGTLVVDGTQVTSSGDLVLDDGSTASPQMTLAAGAGNDQWRIDNQVGTLRFLRYSDTGQLINQIADFSEIGLTLFPHTTTEGGQITLKGGTGGYGDWVIDAYNDSFRVINYSNNNTSFRLFNTGGHRVDAYLHGNLHVGNDFRTLGSNSWVYHTPNDGRTSLYIAPMTNNVWDWGNGLRIDNDGSASFNGRVHVLDDSTIASTSSNAGISPLLVDSLNGLKLAIDSNEIRHFGSSLNISGEQSLALQTGDLADANLTTQLMVEPTGVRVPVRLSVGNAGQRGEIALKRAFDGAESAYLRVQDGESLGVELFTMGGSSDLVLSSEKNGKIRLATNLGGVHTDVMHITKSGVDVFQDVAVDGQVAVEHSGTIGANSGAIGNAGLLVSLGSVHLAIDSNEVRTFGEALNVGGESGINFQVGDAADANLKNAMSLTVDGLRIFEEARINEFSTDTTLSGNSDTAVPTEKAVKTYVDNAVSAGVGGMVAVVLQQRVNSPSDFYPDPSSNAWAKRPLTLQAGDPAGQVSVSSGQFTLQPGTYVIDGFVSDFDVSTHTCRLVRTDTGAEVGRGSSAYTSKFNPYSSGGSTSASLLQTVVVVTSPTTYRLEHWRNGLTDYYNGEGVDVLASLSILKIQ